MYSFSCVLWAIFWSFPLLSFVRQPAIFLIIEAEMPQKLIPNHRTINSKLFLNTKPGGKDAKTNMEATGETGTVLRGLRHAHGKEGTRWNGNIVKVFQRIKQGKPPAWKKGGTRGAF